MYTSLPPKQGLYDPWFEHDACGLGVVANIKGRKSNKILRQALVVLRYRTATARPLCRWLYVPAA